MAEPAYPNNETRFPEDPELGEAPLISEPRYQNVAPVTVPGSRSSLALNTAAENIGSALGNAVERVKQLPDRVQDMRQRFTVIRGHARQDMATRAADMAEEARQQARRKAIEARSRAQFLAHEQPLRFILGAAAFGFVLGIVLRIGGTHAE